jgi:hypothetical protein
MPTGAFTEKKDTDRLNLGVPGDAPAWLDSMRLWCMDTLTPSREVIVLEVR